MLYERKLDVSDHGDKWRSDLGDSAGDTCTRVPGMLNTRALGPDPRLQDICCNVIIIPGRGCGAAPCSVLITAIQEPGTRGDKLETRLGPD